MDVFNRLVTQLNDLFKSMSPGARITAGLLLVAVVVSLGYLFNAQSGGAEAYLLNGQSFTADEMAAMEGAFGKAGLSDYTVEGSRIRVTKARQAAFLGALADAGAMPARFGDFLGQATSAAGPFTGREQREEMIKIAKQKELALVIRSMNGVESAAVHYDSQKQPRFNKAPITTASVSVKTRGQLPLPESQVVMIRSLVASAIAGLQPENVTIADLNGGRSYHGKSGPAGSALDDAYLSRTREHQGDIEAKIRERLSYIAGVLVSANVELDREMVKSSEVLKVDPKTVTTHQTTEENTLVSTSSPGPGGRPGLATQQPNAPASLPSGGGGSQTEDTKSKTQTTSVASHETTRTQLAGLTPKRVTVSIGVPSTYFEKIWEQRNPTPAGQDKKKPDQAALTAIQDEELKLIREAVQPLVPPPTDATAPVDASQLINVTAFSAVPLPEPVGPSMVSQAVDWIAQSWTSVAMVGLAVIALMMLRSFVQAIPAAPEMPTVHATTVSGDEEAASGENAAGVEGKEGAKPKQRSLQRKSGTGMSLREELVEMVREDPDAAANILRGWIGST
jgi:flagellar M-ring protein FliF